VLNVANSGRVDQLIQRSAFTDHFLEKYKIKKDNQNKWLKHSEDMPENLILKLFYRYKTKVIRCRGRPMRRNAEHFESLRPEEAKSEVDDD
jgi:hypothetical protein